MKSFQIEQKKAFLACSHFPSIFTDTYSFLPVHVLENPSLFILNEYSVLFYHCKVPPVFLGRIERIPLDFFKLSCSWNTSFRNWKIVNSFLNCPTIWHQSQKFNFFSMISGKPRFCFKSSIRLNRLQLSWQQCWGICSSKTTLSVCKTSATWFSVA